MERNPKLSATQEGALRGRFLAARQYKGGVFSEEKIPNEQTAWELFLNQPYIRNLFKKEV